MPSIYELSVLAGAAYDLPDTIAGWSCTNKKSGDGTWDGLQAATFVKNGETMLAFRCTAVAKN